jgi:putative endonuclease
VEGVRGELDLVTRDRDTLVVVEVKTRRSTLAGTASEAVGWQKRRRLRRLTGLYLAEHPHRGPVRGDVVALDLDDDGRWAITHHRGVW